MMKCLNCEEKPAVTVEGLCARCDYYMQCESDVLNYNITIERFLKVPEGDDVKIYSHMRVNDGPRTTESFSVKEIDAELRGEGDDD